MGKKNNALLLDCSNLSFNYIPVNFKDLKILITNTNKKRSLATSKYNKRRLECEKGLSLLKTHYPEIKSISNFNINDFDKIQNIVDDKTIFKRIKHVLTENDRVIDSAKALKNNNLKTFGELLNQSHISLRDNYEVTCFELDTIFNESKKIQGVLGTRMTGAEFGGCTLSIIEKDSIDEFKSTISQNYYKATGLTPSFYETNIGDGAKEI